MQVKFKHDHLSHKAGDVANIDEGIGKYLIAVKAVDEVKGEHHVFEHKKPGRKPYSQKA